MEVDQFNKKPKWFKPVQFPEFYKKITTNFRQFFKQQYLIDLVFHCENSESIGAHQMILLQASPIFQRIFIEFGGADCFNQGAKYLGFFSSRSLKTREKRISFAQFVYFLREVCLLFNF